MSGGLLQTVLYTTALLNLCVGLIIWLRQPNRIVNRAYLFLCISVALWIITNALFIDIQAARYIFALLSYTAASLVAIYFLFICTTLANVYSKVTKFIAPLGIPLSFTWAIPGFLATGIDGLEITTTPFITVYAVCLLGCFIVGTAALLKGISITPTELRRQQLLVMLLGFIGAMAGGLTLNLILPLMGNYRYVQFGPAFSLLFVFASGYAIVRHKLFDVRFALMRIAAYSLSVISVGGVIGLLAASVISLFDVSSVSLPFIIVSAAVIVAAVFGPVKSYFDRVTYRFFYIAQYDPQVVIDTLTSMLARAVNQRRIAQMTGQLLQETLSTQFVSICTVNEVRGEYRKLNSTRHKETYVLDAALKELLPTITEDVFAVDEASERDRDLADKISKSNIAVVAKLRSAQGVIGYLIVGYKQNATAFSRQDIDLLDIARDELSIALENAIRFEEIEKFSQTLQLKVDDATEELKVKNKKLKELDTSKDEFISMASHQLRTPLTSIKGYLSMVLEGDLGDVTPTQRKVLEEAYASSQRMVYLIGDFLNVSRLQTGKFELEASKVELPEIIAEEIGQLRATAAARQLKITYTPPSNFPTLLLDENKIRQVMMNFIDNAIYYSRPNTTITIDLIKHAHHVTFRVKDEGIGVPTGERHKLFTKFYRASNAKQQRPDGTGIGLFMAKKVIVAHDGAVIFESKEGKGSTFGFRLPVIVPDEPAQK